MDKLYFVILVQANILYQCDNTFEENTNLRRTVTLV